MNKPEQLLKRLDEIGKALSKEKDALALIGLGSAGMERNRLDEFSDLDFFAIVRQGSKARYLNHLNWLSEISPVAYSFANTADGYKLLYEDGIFCEFAVFDEEELKEAVFSPGKVIWKAEGVADNISVPQILRKQNQPPSTDWLIGEALTNLYVGLSRDKRGEKLSGMRFIQNYAVDRILELAKKVEAVSANGEDVFNIERRYEQRVPAMLHILPQFLQGYERNKESALAVLEYLEKHFEINPAMKQVILALV